jgi:hypothetical protein
MIRRSTPSSRSYEPNQLITRPLYIRCAVALDFYSEDTVERNTRRVGLTSRGTVRSTVRTTTVLSAKRLPLPYARGFNNGSSPFSHHSGKAKATIQSPGEPMPARQPAAMTTYWRPA